METIADKTKYALECILWYNGYFNWKSDDIIDGEVDPYCFCNVLWNVVSHFANEAEHGKIHNVTGDELDYYMDQISNKYDVEVLDSKINAWGKEAHTIWMFLVGMFGDWGTSIRSGCISEFNECKEWLEEMLQYYVGEMFDVDGNKKPT